MNKQKLRRLVAKLFNKKIICTHDGKFHADDVYGVAVLDLFFKGKVIVVRSRKQEDIDSADVVVDNGRAYDVHKQIFDHHQAGGAGVRENGVPYAGFGLVWKHFGKELCQRFGADEKTWQEIDLDFISQIDAADNGYEAFYNEKLKNASYVSDSVVKKFMPTWTENYSDAYKNFMKCVAGAKEILIRLIIQERDKQIGKKEVMKIYNNSSDKRVIYLEKGYSWKSLLSELPEPLFAVFPEVNSGRFMIQGVPIKKGEIAIRQKFPSEWAGLVSPELEKVSGIDGLNFCHNGGFLCVVSDLNVAKQVIAKILP